MKPSEAKTLYEEVTNDQGTWVDVAFWYILGILSTVLVQWAIA